MPLPLDKALKREVVIGGAPYTVTVSPLGVKLVRKGFRRGRAVSWRLLLEQLGGDPAGDPDDAADDGTADAEGGTGEEAGRSA